MVAKKRAAPANPKRSRKYDWQKELRAEGWFGSDGGWLVSPSETARVRIESDVRNENHIERVGGQIGAQKMTPQLVWELISRENHLAWDVSLPVRVVLTGRDLLTGGDFGREVLITLNVAARTASAAAEVVEHALQNLLANKFVEKDRLDTALRDFRYDMEHQE